MKKNRLPNGKYIFEWGGLVANAGGMTRAMLKRADSFIREGTDVTILLSARGLDQLKSIEHYVQNGYPYITEKNFVVMENFFGEKCSNNMFTHSFREFEMLENIPYEFREKKKYYYENGEIIAIENETMSSDKRVIELTASKEKLMVWDDAVRCIVKEIETEKGVKTRIEKFISKTGFCHTRIENIWDKDKWVVTDIKLFSEKDRTVQSFISLEELRQFFFIEYVKECDEKEIFVFCDPILDFWPGFQYMKDESKNIYRIAINHGVGFGGDRNWNSTINPRLKCLIEDVTVPEIEALALLTKQALNDFSKRLGNRKLFYYIPNTINIPKKMPDFNERNLRRAVYVGRFEEKQKQISHIIKAFAKAVEKFPDVELHLYGRGEDYNMYKNLIESLDVSKNIIIESFSNNVYDIYQKSAFSIVASSFEGAPLSLAESLANGCPVVAYNFKYGQEDYIVHGVNGVVCELNNIDQLSIRICQMFSMDLKELEQMSINANKMIQSYNENTYLSNWEKVLWDLVNKRNTSYISDFSISIKGQNINSIMGEISIWGEIKIDGKVDEKLVERMHIYMRRYNDTGDDYERIDIDVKWLDDKKYFIFELIIPYTEKEKLKWICIEFQDQFLHKELQLL